MIPRNRWQGWTLFAKGGLVLEHYTRTPVIYPSKAQAEKQKEPDEEIVRCELKIARSKS